MSSVITQSPTEVSKFQLGRGGVTYSLFREFKTSNMVSRHLGYIGQAMTAGEFSMKDHMPVYNAKKNSAIANMAAQSCTIRISAVMCGVLHFNALSLSLTSQSYSLQTNTKNHNFMA